MTVHWFNPKRHWSPEPWETYREPSYPEQLTWIGCADGHVATCDEETGPHDAARIVTCVNALAGISDPAALVKSYDEMLSFLSRYYRKGLIGDGTPKCPVESMIARAKAARK